MAQSLFDNENTQFELSYEFLALLKWLVEHEPEQIRKIVARAVRHGFKEGMERPTTVDAEFVQSSIVDFLELLDALLLEAVQEQRLKKALNQNLMTAIDQIDAKACDKSIVETSLDKASEKIDSLPNKNPKDILCAELLKRWKPVKNQHLN